MLDMMSCYRKCPKISRLKNIVAKSKKCDMNSVASFADHENIFLNLNFLEKGYVTVRSYILGG